MYEIQISFKDKKSNLITFNQYKYTGTFPEINGLEKAKYILNNYFCNVDIVEVEVYEDGKIFKERQYKKDMLLREDFYFKVKTIISKGEGNEEVSNSRIIGEIKKELEKYRDRYE